MAISASMVKELRERTGAGMMDCKKALVETDGDIEAAIEHLRKSGKAKADKKSSRIAAEGVVVVRSNGSKAVVIEVNSETDFVAKDENFLTFVNAVADAALASGQVDVASLADDSLADGQTVEGARTELVNKVGENISVRRLAQISHEGPVSHYIHGAKIAAVVALEGGDEDLARDVAMHIAATNPNCIDETGVPAETLENERRILTEQAQESGKPPEIVEKWSMGALPNSSKKSPWWASLSSRIRMLPLANFWIRLARKSCRSRASKWARVSRRRLRTLPTKSCSRLTTQRRKTPIE